MYTSISAMCCLLAVNTDTSHPRTTPVECISLVKGVIRKLNTQSAFCLVKGIVFEKEKKKSDYLKINTKSGSCCELAVRKARATESRQRLVLHALGQSCKLFQSLGEQSLLSCVPARGASADTLLSKAELHANAHVFLPGSQMKLQKLIKPL